MDYDHVEAPEFGASLKGIGLNLLVRDVPREVAFLKEVFGMAAFQPTEDFAIMTYGDQVFQIHADHTYHSHPLPSLLPEAGARGAGIEIRLYDSDPDEAAQLAQAHGAHILELPTDKPHGLRETFILCENGYAWVASRAL
jgi:predicted enzyme related to lactoylglutathione lyase